MTFPDAATRLAGVLGHPVGHSLSPPIHNAALRHDGVNGIYLAFDVAPGRLEAALGGLGAVGSVGVNVTIPHKLDALHLSSRRSTEAERVGAANVLVFTSDGPEAHNTDVIGVHRALHDLGVDPQGATCLVLGAGGAGRAAVWALSAARAREIIVANRTPSRAREVVDALTEAGTRARVVPWEEREAALPGCDAFVNTTSIGLDDHESPLGREALERAAVGGCRGALDLVYRPGETPLVRDARAAGLPAADGLGMLVHQAAETYRCLWGHLPDVAVMDEAARTAIGRGTDARQGRPPIV